MNTSIMRAGIFKNKVTKVMLTIALGVVMGGLVIAPAFADDNRGHDERDYRNHDEGRHHHRYHHHTTYYYEEPGYYPYYEQPVYAPPPVYYAPEPSPGINLFFPIHIH